MGLADLLWACPECGADRGLNAQGRAYVCRSCATRFRRGRGADIRAERPDGTVVVRSPAEWTALLPDPAGVLREGGAETPLRAARVTWQEVTGFDTVRDRDGYLNRVELWGDERPGRLELWPDALVHVPEGEGPTHSPLDSVIAVQASSSSLQVNRREQPLVSFRFEDDSILLWEELLRAALRDFFRRTGRGEIVEFQPRIATR